MIYKILIIKIISLIQENYLFRNIFLLLTIGSKITISVLAQTPWLKPEKDYWKNKNKPLYFNDFIYDSNIKTVLFYPLISGNAQEASQTPTVPLSQPYPLILQFDELGDVANYYMAKIIHCNADWKPSSLNSLEFLDTFNEFRINDFEFSNNTRVPYVHFEMTLPKVKVSGNYLLKVYHEGNENQIIITKRFIVYEEVVFTKAELVTVVGGQDALTKQQVNVEVSFNKDLQLKEPATSIKAVIRQNYRWDNSLTLKPLYVKENTLDFKYFSLENAFWAGNEFRNFEFFNLMTGGLNVKKAVVGKTMNSIELQLDYVRGDKTFNNQLADIEGSYFVNCMCNMPSVDADYAQVNFYLNAPEPYLEDVYVVGGFSNWNLLPENKMFYFPDKKAYHAQILLKQGLYDYEYILYSESSKKRDDVTIEGSFRLAENIYDVLIYYSPFGSRADRIIGYKKVMVQ
ncbi:MAG: DUF5103 domain-containing protein [Flammeovirgaceae bacterium]